MKVLYLMSFCMFLMPGCAERVVDRPAAMTAAMTAAPVVKGAKDAACTGLTAPDRRCSQTVTAAFSAQGVLWLAWVQSDHVFVQFSLDKGLSFSAPVMVNPIAEPVIAHDEYRPKIQLDKQGNIYLTWTRSLEKRHTGHIRFSRSVDGGKTFSAPVTINDNLEEISHRFDSLAVTESGEVFVAWLDARDKVRATRAGIEHPGTSLYYAWSDNRGETFEINKLAAPHTCECCRLGTAIDKDNLPVVIWRHVFPGGIRDHALLKFTAWNQPGEIKRLSQENWKIDACPHHGPALAVADDGAYHAAWFSGAEGRQGLFHARSKDQGRSFSTAMPFGGQGAKHPHLAVNGQHVAIVWLEFDGSNTLVKLLQSFDGGHTWEDAKNIAQAAGAADYAFLLAYNDVMYLSWQTRQGYRIEVLDELL